MKKFLEELKAESVDEKVRRYKSNWLQHVTIMNNSRIPQIMLNYRSNGEGDLEDLWRYYQTRPDS
jgi:hypothetical protein